MIGVTATKDADYYLNAPCRADEQHHGPAEYEMGAVAAGEPAGVWLGSNPFGLEGEVQPDHFRALVDQLRDPFTGQSLGTRPYHYLSADERVAAFMVANPDASEEEVSAARVRAEKDKKGAVHAWDITFSLPKSWSVLHAALEREGRHEDAEAVWAAAQEGITAALDVARREHSYVRTQVKGEAPTYQQAPEWTAAMFRHHTSRDHDPQLHVHVSVINRVFVDGEWKALYSPALTKNKHHLDAVFLRVAEAALTRSRNVHFAARPDGKAREIVGVPAAARDLFSARTRSVVAGAHRLVQEFEAKYGAAPTGLTRYLLHQQVTLATRQAKRHVSREQSLEEWENTLAAQIRGGLASVVTGVDEAREEEIETPLFDPVRVIAAAVADLDSRKATWSRSHLYLAISNHLPDHVVTSTAAEMVELLDDLTDAALIDRGVVPIAPRPVVKVPTYLLDPKTGRSTQDVPHPARFTTRAQLQREQTVVARLEHSGAPVVPVEQARKALEPARLNPAQFDVAMTALTDPHRMQVVVAPAGTGKSRTVGAISDASETLTGRHAVGFTVAQNAAQVMVAEGIGQAHNIAAYLDFAERAEQGKVSQQERDTFHVAAGSTVVIDEASMVSASQFQQLTDRLDEAGVGRVLVVGDTGQFDAPAQAGTFALLAERREPQTLTEVHRFRADWEKAASVALRDGATEEATRAYDSRGRLHGGSQAEVEAELVRDSVNDIKAGRDVVTIAATSDDAARLSSSIREQLVAAGRVDEGGVALRDGTVAGVGDVVQARLNEKDLEGGPVVNRETFRVTAVQPDGALEVQRNDGRDAAGERLWGPPRALTLAYARDWVELGYAGTGHAVEGRTADVSRTLTGELTTRAALYVGAGRGRDANHVYLPTRDGETAAGRFAQIVENDRQELSATAAMAQADEQAHSLAELGPRWQAAITEQRAAVHSDVVREVLGRDAAKVLEDKASHTLFASLRSAETAGHDPRELLSAAYAHGDLDGTRSPAAALHDRIDREMDRSPRGEGHRPFTYESRTPQIALGADNARIQHARDLATAMDDRTAVLGARAAEAPEPWALERFGPVPDDPAARGAWVGKAAVVAGYREQYGWDDPHQAIGPMPGRGEPEKQWAWTRGADLMGLSADERSLAAASDGDLLNREKLWADEQKWMPPNVDTSLKVAHGARDEADRQAVDARVSGRDGREADAVLARQTGRVAQLEEIAAAREKAVQETARTRDMAREAAAERERRAQPSLTSPVSTPADAPAAVQQEPAREPLQAVEPAQRASEPEHPDLNRGLDPALAQESAQDRTMHALNQARDAAREDQTMDAALDQAREATRELAERSLAREQAAAMDGPAMQMDQAHHLDQGMGM